MKRRDRGSGSIFKPAFKDKDGTRRECPHWRISYYRRGVRFVENTHSELVSTAKELLKRRLGEISLGQFVPPSMEKTTVTELYDALLLHYRNSKPVAAYTLEKKWAKHLQPFFGRMLAADVTTNTIERYKAKRLDEKAQGPTINRELAMLRRMFVLGRRSTPPRVREIPYFTRFTESSPRQGFVDAAQYRLLCQHCPEPWLRVLLAVAYAFGFRRGELLNLRVKQVDLLARTITLDPGTTKNREGRTVVMTETEEAYLLLVEAISGKGPDDFVFTRHGRRITDMRAAWSKMVKAAGMPDLLLHDLRRSAVRNMIRAGVSEDVAMRISGHKSRAIFARYNITVLADIEDAAKKREAAKENSTTLAQVTRPTGGTRPVVH